MTTTTCPKCGHTFSTDDDDFARALHEDAVVTGLTQPRLRIEAHIVESTHDDEEMRGEVGVRP